jgi:hypothetical protein
MKYKVCTCAYQKCKDYGLNPQNHSPSCPMYKQDNNSPYQEIWVNVQDEVRYNEVNEKRRKKTISKKA